MSQCKCSICQEAVFYCMKYNKRATSWQNQQNDCAPSEDSDQPGHPHSLIRVFAVRSVGSLGHKLSSCGQRRLWSDWVDPPADLSLRLAHGHFVGFVTMRLKLFWLKKMHALIFSEDTGQNGLGFQNFFVLMGVIYLLIRTVYRRYAILSFPACIKQMLAEKIKWLNVKSCVGVNVIFVSADHGKALSNLESN